LEQSASAAYPNVLVADYLKKAGPASKEKAGSTEDLVREGYQRILTFQNSDGGFGWWTGGGNPQVWVTAYALHLLRDSARVIEIDSKPLERARRWLQGRQSHEGSWTAAGISLEASLGAVSLTAYVTWALGGDERAAQWLEGYTNDGDAYQAALVALALSASGHPAGARRAAARLATMKWVCAGTLSYGRGKCGEVETAGLAVQALVATGVSPERMAKGIELLVSSRRDGDWGSTQATVQALRALTSASEGGHAGERIHVVFRAGGITRDLDVVLGGGVTPTIDVTDLLGSGAIEVETKSHLSLVLQAVERHYEKWIPEAPSALSMEVTHPDRCSVGRPARVAARVRGAAARMVIAEVGLAPGASPRVESLEKLVAGRQVTRYEVRPDRVVFYLSEVEREARLEFDVVPRLQAEACVRPGCVYEFYDPDRVALVPTSRVSIVP
jgi:hypothetical protein